MSNATTVVHWLLKSRECTVRGLITGPGHADALKWSLSSCAVNSTLLSSYSDLLCSEVIELFSVVELLNLTDIKILNFAGL